nr:reverse transcriptase domain-containing protein [Tanacetum cinerariifolium]
SKFINEFFPPSRTTSLRNEILNFQQRFDESFHEAWDRYKDLLRACPHHDFIELHQLNTFYNALNPTDQDSLNAAAGGNLLKRSTQDVLTIIKNKSKVRNSRSKPIASQVKSCDANFNSEIAKLTHAFNQQTSAMTTAMMAMLKQFQATPPPAPVKAVEEIYVTCRAMQTQIDMVKNELRNKMKTSIQTSLSNKTNEIKNIMASLLQMNIASTLGSWSLPSNTVANPKGKLKAITTRSGLVTDGPTVPTPPKSITPEVDERVKETYTDPNLTEYTIKVPPPPVQKYKPPELKCKALADLGASINLMPLSVWKELGLPELIPTCMTLELANRAICTPVGIAKDVFVPVGKFTFPVDFVIVDYESDPRVPLILGRHFLRTARALIDVHAEEMILRASDKRLTLNMRHDTSSYSNQPQRESDNLINIFNVSSKDFLEFDIKSDLKEIEFLLYQDKDSSLKDSIDQKDLANLDDIFVDPVHEMFTDEHTPDYSYPPIFDVYNDDFLEVESDVENVNDASFDSKEEKIKEFKLLIDELDLPCDFFLIPRILIHEKPVEIITRVAQDTKLAISNASLVLEDFDPPFYEPLFFKEVPKLKMLLPFSFENEEKVFKPGIYISEK